MVVALPVPPLLSPPVLAELQQADLITSEECKRLHVIWYWHSLQCEELSDILYSVAIVQSRKSPEVMLETAGVLRRHGFKKECRWLEGL